MIIDINMDSVLINGTSIPRPTRISRSAWIKFWEGVNASLSA